MGIWKRFERLVLDGPEEPVVWLLWLQLVATAAYLILLAPFHGDWIEILRGHMAQRRPRPRTEARNA